jgi:hypothetical protein
MNLAYCCEDRNNIFETLPVWRRPREVEVVTNTAVWYHSGKPCMLLRWVLIRDPNQCFEPQALLSTNLDQTPERILTY